MIKKLFLTACLFLAASVTSAQNIFEVNNISQPNDVYTSAGDDAAVIIRCHTSIPLTFTSTMDKSATPFRSEVQGSDSVYYIAFPTGIRYRGRELIISSRGYLPISIPLELQPKQLLSFRIIDPNAQVDAGCYRMHRNKGVEEIKNANYEEARNQFVVARQCTDCDSIENETNIAMVDSLIYCRQQGDAAYQLLDYKTAATFYHKILAQNAYDTYASNRYTLCVQNFMDECTTIFTKAEYYYSEKEFDKAKELYEKVMEKECRNMAIAEVRLNAINKQSRAKQDHSRVLTYELRKDVPIGFSYGKYHMHKAGGFISFDLNKTVFDALRSDCKYGDDKFAELNIAFGWTIKIANPVWIHFGPGFTAKLYHGTYLNKKYPEKGYGEHDLMDVTKMGDDLSPKDEFTDDEVEDAWRKANFAGAVSPVVGLTVKYSYFAFRLSYQYRWSFKSELADFIGRNRISVGIGVAF